MPRKRSSKKNFWTDPRTVADQLFGKHMVVGGKTVTIRNTQGFLREEGMRSLYEPMLTMEPGEVYCPKFAQSVLLVIATLDDGEKGGRVLIREIEHEGKVITGPGNVSKFLGIQVANMHGVARWVNQETFQIDWD